MAKEIPFPKEIEVLNPELNKAVIAIGTKAYEMYPLYEGQLEIITDDIEKLYEAIFCPDRKCPKCGKVVKKAAPRGIQECPDDKEFLEGMSLSPIGAILKSSKIPVWIEAITGVPQAEVKANLTLNQIKHFAGEFWRQNFAEGYLPETSQQNFKKLLEMIGMGGEKKPEKPAIPAATEKEAPQA